MRLMSLIMLVFYSDVPHNVREEGQGRRRAENLVPFFSVSYSKITVNRVAGS